MRRFLLIFVLTVLLVYPAYSGATDKSRPCMVNFSLNGGFWSGYVVKNFQEYTKSSKAATFNYLLKKIASIGYKINSSDKDAGLISASWGRGDAASLNAAITELNPTGVRVDLTFTTSAAAVALSEDEARTEFCSILDDVPSNSSDSITQTPQAVPARTAATLNITDEKPLTNSDVMALAQAKIGDDVIILKIQEAQTEVLDVSTNAILTLKKEGISGPVIQAMVKRVSARKKQ